MRRIGLLAAGLAAAAAPAWAAVSGNVTATSAYLFRGVQRDSATLQGSLDYTREDGWYSGLFGSGCEACGGSELDFYGGWSGALANGVSVQAGAVYYLFAESDEGLAPSLDYPEIFAGAGYRGFGATLYYTNDYLDEASDVPGSDQNAFYLTADYSHTLREGLELVLQIGRSWGDGIEAVFGDEYLDYSLTLVKTLDDGFSLSVAVIDTDLERRATATMPGIEDDPKFVVGLAKDFGF